MDVVDRKRVFFLLFLSLIMFGGLWLMKEQVVRLEQYQCYIINYGVVNNSQVSGYTQTYDITCFNSTQYPTITCYGCAKRSTGLFLKAEINAYSS